MWLLTSEVMKSNLFTMGVASNFDHRQKIPHAAYQIPDEASRLLSAQLILEEALETIHGLGFYVYGVAQDERRNKLATEPVSDDYVFVPHGQPVDMIATIDGACDTIYVCTRALASFGVPDLPHLEEVCRANNAKFPGGIATIDPSTGKYQKPSGWIPPDHEAVRKKVDGDHIEDLFDISLDLIHCSVDHEDLGGES